MFVAYAVVGALLALVLLASARAKIVRDEKVVGGLRKVGVLDKHLNYLATLEIAGALGLIAGIFWAPLGIAAAIGVILYFVGAVTAHLRVGDKAGLPPAAVLLVAGIATLILRFASI
jgi:hypothetical protein